MGWSGTPCCVGPRVNLVEAVPPERLQPHPTLIERTEAAGLEVTLVGPPEHAESPLTRAILRGRRYRGALTLDEVVQVIGSALDEGLRAVYAYHPFLDTTGHVNGIGSPEWVRYLGQVDRAVAAVAELLPAGWVLAVTGDHGMVDLTDEQKVDLDREAVLLHGVRVLAGEARARHVHTQPGAAADVRAAWDELVGDRMWVSSRDEAIEAGWFGPRVDDEVRPRIGDVVAAAFGPIGIVQRSVDPLQASLVGHHGSMTPEEQLVPFVLVRPG